ncbi:MAG: WecB/TagA/CpsF family glycosyltransferase, partial [Candidatus Paceibacterota bacterium]
MPENAKFLSVDVALATKAELLWAIDTAETPVRVATLNPEFMLEARSNGPFREALHRMTHCTVDGTGLYWFLSRFRNRLGIGATIEHYQGADLVEDLFSTYQNGEKSFFFLGGPEGQARDAAASVRNRFPAIRIVGAESGGTISPSNPFTEAHKSLLESTNPDILLVGFGAPKQELWIDAARDLPISTMVGIGGTFGFYTTKKRAPKLF